MKRKMRFLRSSRNNIKAGRVLCDGDYKWSRELMGCAGTRKGIRLVVVACCRSLGDGACREGDWLLACLMVGLFADGRLKNKEERRIRVG